MSEQPKAVYVPLIGDPMALYESFRREAIDRAPQVVRGASTLEEASAAYTVVHRLTMMVHLLSGSNLDVEGVVALLRKLQDDVEAIQHAMYQELMRRQSREDAEV